MFSILLLSVLTGVFHTAASAQVKPNVIIIYADDLGYGDLSCYGATKIKTPHLDKLAGQGIRFTNGHSVASVCTPSRYALMTGQYPWRVPGTGILPGDAALIIPQDKLTLPKVFRQAGYETGIVGKWHLGLGNAVAKDWNGTIQPGPNETGFDYSFIFPATADRVPTVFVENHHMVALDPADPVAVSYEKKIGDEPTGKEHPELLKMKAAPDHGHDNTIVNGIGRIGYMSGGKLARWTDEEMPLTFLLKAKQFINDHDQSPFFLYYALTEPHVPRMPSTVFKGKSGLGLRGDVILQMDWSVGEIMKEVERLGIADNTIIIFSSDNGPVLNDGYEDEAVTKLNGHTPNGPLRGGKYSSLEAGTRVPFIISWPGTVKPGVSDALICQIDFIASFSALLNQSVPAANARDSENILKALLGQAATGRSVLVKQGVIPYIIKDNWKYIPPNAGPGRTPADKTNIETGNLLQPQLYNLAEDLGEGNNLAAKHPAKVKELADLLENIKHKN